jgi:UDP-N-acetylmuramate-alanine ligase
MTHHPAFAQTSPETTNELHQRRAQPGDLVVTLGAGSIGAMGERILAALGATAVQPGDARTRP